MNFLLLSKIAFYESSRKRDEQQNQKLVVSSKSFYSLCGEFSKKKKKVKAQNHWRVARCIKIVQGLDGEQQNKKLIRSSKLLYSLSGEFLKPKNWLKLKIIGQTLNTSKSFNRLGGEQ